MGKFVPSYQGYGEVLRGSDVAGACSRAAANAAADAGSLGGVHGAYVTDVQVGRKRVHARAETKPGDRAAYYSERKTGVLKAIRPRL